MYGFAKLPTANTSQQLPSKLGRIRDPGSWDLARCRDLAIWDLVWCRDSGIWELVWWQDLAIWELVWWQDLGIWEVRKSGKIVKIWEIWDPGGLVRSGDQVTGS